MSLSSLSRKAKIHDIAPWAMDQWCESWSIEVMNTFSIEAANISCFIHNVYNLHQFIEDRSEFTLNYLFSTIKKYNPDTKNKLDYIYNLLKDDNDIFLEAVESFKNKDIMITKKSNGEIVLSHRTNR